MKNEKRLKGGRIVLGTVGDSGSKNKERGKLSKPNRDWILYKNLASKLQLTS